MSQMLRRIFKKVNYYVFSSLFNNILYLKLLILELMEKLCPREPKATKAQCFGGNWLDGSNKLW